MNQPLVQFRNVQKSYDGETLVVKDLNLDVAQGEFLTLLGPSGSGKTTSLLMLAGFETATSGEILLDGKPITHIAPEKRNIGMVFQNYALFPHMTVAENVAFPLKVRKMAGRDVAERVRRALDMVGLAGFGTRRPAQMSGGQQQRVAVARALVFEPKLVLMDEPLSALDKQLREQLQYEIKRLHRDLGLTVVYVTHDQSEALAMSDRVAVFHQGVIQQIDDPISLYERPCNAFVAQFIGENNAFDGHVDTVDGDQCRVRLPDGSLIPAQRVADHGSGERTRLSLRPERVVIEPEPHDVDIRVPARVVDVTYLGKYARVRLRACGLEHFVVAVPNDGRAKTLAPASQINIGWRAHDCRALNVE
ncbi:MULTISPECIES: ABC transporter ATP-binding protein [unclassified Burkholderia]|uniref:ABC transporter ATP-binding protein n=1 Tax=unclassified Burkholderia TaxID=2613784 RepID=UPI002AB2FAAF|nr:MULTISPECIES: ABC transporter ATP-binding protein [unclassified Burkholderia]